MAKIALNVHKRANNLAVRGEIGMYPLSIEIYKTMITYFFPSDRVGRKGESNYFLWCE